MALSENRLALEAARRLVQSLTRPARFPSPLYLHGPSGTGKTLLCQSLLKAALETQPELSAQCVSATELHWPQAESADAGDPLESLLETDILILEGLQYLPARSANTLTRLLDGRSANRRVTVTTASVGPAGLKSLPSRLTSRLASGLVVQLAPLPFPSRRILAEVLTTRRNVFLTADALDLLAADPTGGGVRPLLGAIDRVLNLSAGNGQILDAAELTQLLRDEPRRDEGFCERVIRKVAKTFNISPKELIGPRRHRNVLRPRQVAMYLARNVGKLSFPQIGQEFGGRDHTTVLHACELVMRTLKTDAQLKKTVKDLAAELA